MLTLSWLGGVKSILRLHVNNDGWGWQSWKHWKERHLTKFKHIMVGQARISPIDSNVSEVMKYIFNPLPRREEKVQGHSSIGREI